MLGSGLQVTFEVFIMSRSPLLIVVGLSSAIAGFLIHSAWDRFDRGSTPAPSVEQDEELHLGMKGLVNPLLDCGTVGVSSLKEAQIRESVEKYIAEAKTQGKANTIAVYYRDLNNGPTFGLDSSVLFTPASLLKVPILITYLKKAEKDPALLKRTLVFDPKKYSPGNVTQNIAPPPPLVPGQAYSIEDLLGRMIIHSDNFAAALLTEQPDVDVERTLKEMGVPLVISNDQVWLRVTSYASMFRILFNATYLDVEHSTMALALLSKSTFMKGLSAGVDKETVVAHKFGERGLGDDFQLHDCGIVYVPKTPYLLCVMTRGKTFEHLSESIREISKIVYSNTTRQ